MREVSNRFGGTAMKSLGVAALLQAALAVPGYAAINVSGDVTPADSSAWPGSTLTVGAASYGSLSVTEGSDVLSNAGIVASNGGSSGEVVITGTGSSWVNTTILTVGSNGGSIAAPATLDILDGASVSNTNGGIGMSSLGVGSVVVDNSTWTNNGTLTVGSSGSGTLTIRNGGKVTSTGISNIFGSSTTQGSAVSITGVGSSWSAESLRTGALSTAEVEITAGGALTLSGTAELGYSASTDTAILVSGKDPLSETKSTFASTTTMTIGRNGHVTLEVKEGGQLVTAGATLGSLSGSSGSVSVDGDGSTWTNNVSALTVGSGGTGSLTLTNGGTFVTTGGHVTINASGTVNLEGGVLDMGAKILFFNSGTFNFTDGRLQNTLSFQSSLLQQGGTLAAGAANAAGTMGITGIYTLQEDGTLEVEIAEPGTFDKYNIGGDALLEGLLNVKLLPGFTPEVGQTFDVLTADTIDATSLTLAQPSLYSFEVLGTSGSGQTLRLTIDAIPEPATLALLAVGAACVGFRRQNNH